MSLSLYYPATKENKAQKLIKDSYPDNNMAMTGLAFLTHQTIHHYNYMVLMKTTPELEKLICVLGNKILFLYMKILSL